MSRYIVKGNNDDDLYCVLETKMERVRASQIICIL
jgi:hypothetical protein